jgi:hypothetical protein
MKFGIYILFFSVTVFILTAVGLAILYAGIPILRLWLILVYLFTCPLVFAFAVDFLVGDGKLSGKKVLLLTFGVITISVIVTHSVWTVVTPRWSFSVSTDKPAYILGEDVQITVSLENGGFVTHSFKSSFSDPIIISIERFMLRQVWYSPFHHEITEFTVPSRQSLEWTFIWNQTNKNYPEKEIEPGKYYIRAVIESVTSDSPFWDPLFSAATSINITSS